jgi:hypothetical protein
MLSREIEEMAMHVPVKRCFHERSAQSFGTTRFLTIPASEIKSNNDELWNALTQYILSSPENIHPTD